MGKSVQLRPASWVWLACTRPKLLLSRIKASHCVGLCMSNVGWSTFRSCDMRTMPLKLPSASKRKATGYLLDNSKYTGSTMPPSAKTKGIARTR